MEDRIFYTALENFRGVLGELADACVDINLNPEEEVEREVSAFWDLYYDG